MAHFIEIMLHLSIASSSIILNGLLLFATFLRAPKAARFYTILIRIQTLVDITAPVCILATMQRTAPCEWTFILISYGLCSLGGSSTCFMFYAIMISSYTVSFSNILVCMGARYWILRFGSISRKIIIVAFLICAAFPGTCVFARTIITRIDDFEAERILYRHFLNYATEHAIVTGTTSMRTTSAFITSCIIFSSPFSFVLFMWIYRAAMLSLLKQRKSSMTLDTRVLHRQFVTSLTLQALLPCVTLLCITLLFAGFFNILTGPLLQSNELPALLSPIIVLTHVRHYRSSIQRFFCYSRPAHQIHINVVSRTHS